MLAVIAERFRFFGLLLPELGFIFLDFDLEALYPPNKPLISIVPSAIQSGRGCELTLFFFEPSSAASSAQSLPALSSLITMPAATSSSFACPETFDSQMEKCFFSIYCFLEALPQAPVFGYVPFAFEGGVSVQRWNDPPIRSGRLQPFSNRCWPSAFRAR